MKQVRVCVCVWVHDESMCTFNEIHYQEGIIKRKWFEWFQENRIIISKSTSCTLAYKVQSSIIFNKYSAKETFPAVLKHDHTLYTYKQVTVRERGRQVVWIYCLRTHDHISLSCQLIINTITHFTSYCSAAASVQVHMYTCTLHLVINLLDA